MGCRCSVPRDRCLRVSLASITRTALARYAHRHWRVLRLASDLVGPGELDRSSGRASQSSLVVCLACLGQWRTRSDYAQQLRPATADELVRLDEACEGPERPRQGKAAAYAS